jgi:hypothetical protein
VDQKDSQVFYSQQGMYIGRVGESHRDLSFAGVLRRMMSVEEGAIPLEILKAIPTGAGYYIVASAGVA